MDLLSVRPSPASSKSGSQQSLHSTHSLNSSGESIGHKAHRRGSEDRRVSIGDIRTSSEKLERLSIGGSSQSLAKKKGSKSIPNNEDFLVSLR